MDTPRLSTLEAIDAAVWEQLVRCVADREHPWRTPVLATVDTDTDSGAPRAEARTVVLREVDAAERTLLVYTDARSAKARQLRSHPQATLLMWSPALGWQLRCRVDLHIDEDGLAASSRWARIRLSPAAQDYLSPLPPGSPLDTPALAGVDRAHFAVVTARVHDIDWLELHADGHWRASLSTAGHHWLQP